MKSILTILIIFLISFTAKSQLTKGNWLVGGSGTFYSYTEDFSTPTYEQTAKYTNIDISPSIGYFIVTKFAAGLRPSFSSSKGKVISTSIGSGGSTNSYNLSVGPFVRYYFLRDNKPFNLLTDLSYQVGLNRRLGVLHSKGKNNTFSVMGGSEIFFNSTAGMEILLGYTQKTLSIEDSPDAFNQKRKGFQVSVGFTLHLQKD